MRKYGSSQRSNHQEDGDTRRRSTPVVIRKAYVFQGCRILELRRNVSI